MQTALIRVMLIWLMLPGVVFAQVAVSAFKTGAVPAWVELTTAEPSEPRKSDQESGGQVFTLVDTQVNAAKAETFIHVIKEITTESGVQNGANLEFAWDPSFQTLTIHQITVHRGAEHMEHLDPAKFKIIQQETDLNRQIYNGTLSAVQFLEDVRVGDRIEFAYTLQGENPSLQGRYVDSFMLGGPLPIGHRRIRLLWPEGRSLGLRPQGTTIAPKVRTSGGIKEYNWDLRDVPAVVVEDQTPTWFQVYPFVQLSEFANWSEVAAWAARSYVSTNLDAPELKEKITSLRQTGATAEQLVQKALEFTQNDIRYLGLEFGPHSYNPTDPVMVLHRRFGDCKDKAFLLCTLLRGLGFDAAPLLVATGVRHTLPDFLPSPYDFNHVIVRVVIGEETYWLDPTRAHVRGPISQRYQPLYAFGLLVRSGETDLTPIPFSAAGAPEAFTAEVFRVGAQKASTQLSVTSTYYGFDAEWMRAVLAAGGRERLAKSYLNDYAQRYPGVKSSSPMVLTDSSDRDTVTLTHNYSITNFWTLSADKQRYSCQFYPLGIHSWIAKPATAVRSLPMELAFPRLRSIQTRIELPREFKLSNVTNTITGPAAELRVERTYRGQTVWLNYEYKALTNYVPVALTSEHLRSLDEMEAVLPYSLNWQNMDGVGSTSQFNWPIFLLVTIYAIGFLTGVSFLCRHQCRFQPAESAAASASLESPKVVGLGGWLILVGFGLVISPLRLLMNMRPSISSFALWKWHALTTPGGVSYQAAWGPILTLEFLGQISILILNMFVVGLFFQKRRVFPNWFIALLACNALFVVLDMFGVQLLSLSSSANAATVSRGLVQSLIGCSLWIPYMLRSSRVRATFVR